VAAIGPSVVAQELAVTDVGSMTRLVRRDVGVKVSHPAPKWIRPMVDACPRTPSAARPDPDRAT